MLGQRVPAMRRALGSRGFHGEPRDGLNAVPRRQPPIQDPIHDRITDRIGGRSDLSSAFFQGLAYCSGLAAVAAFAAYIADPPRVIAAAEPVVQSQWTDVERPFPAFALPIPEAGEAPERYAIQRHTGGGGRKDILMRGEPATDAPYLQLEIYRPGAELADFGKPADEIMARAGALGVARGVTPGDALPTKFGTFATVTFAVGGETPKACTGFAHTDSEPRLQIAGLFCQPGDVAVDRSVLACALDRLTLVAAGSDPNIGALFARAERHRTFCGQRNPLMAPTPKYQTLWKAIEQKQRAAGR